jgi:hypothetical protein
MFKLSTLAIAGTAALALAATAPQPAKAGAILLTPALGSPHVSSHVEEVQWRRHRHSRRDRNAAIALGLGAAVIGGALASRHYGYYGAPYGYYGAPHAYYGAPPPVVHYRGDGWAECQARFRSLRADGTYTTYDGRQVLCPYLR